MGPQKELDETRLDRFDITEYEENLIPNPKFGPWESNEQFDEYHCFDFFSKEKLQMTVERFRALTEQAGLSNGDYTLIEEGIASFTDSSTKLTKEQSLLYHSILDWQPGVLTTKFEMSGEEVQQTISERYFENFEYLNEYPFETKDLIPDSSLHIYRSCAEIITLETLREWVAFSNERDGDHAWAQNFDTILIYRGINNSKYYQHRQKKGDLISIYAGTEGEEFPYFEKYLLSSYTLSPNLAEQFMVGSKKRKSRRRTLIEGHTEIIENRIFSSFIVSPNFRPSQFEFICLPDLKNISATTNQSGDIYTSIVLSHIY